MAIIAKDSGGGDFVNAPPGVWQAVCVDIVDLGMIKSTMYDKTEHKIRIIWEINEDIEPGKRYTVSKRYTLSLHEKSALRKDAIAWRGRDFTPEQLKGFDVEQMLGANCQLQILHVEKDGKTYANVVAIMPLMKGMPKIASTPTYVRVKDRPGAQPAHQDSPSDDEVSVISDDDIPF